MDDQDRRPFLDAIIARPDDDQPRLIAADFLAENGEAERGEFIRVQCELARHDKAIADGKHDSDVMKWHQLRRRERELLSATTSQGRLLYTNRYAWLGPITSLDGTAEFHRGFVSEVACTAHAWQHLVGDRTIGQEVMLAHPIRRVAFAEGLAMTIGHKVEWTTPDGRQASARWSIGLNGALRAPRGVPHITYESMVAMMPRHLIYWGAGDRWSGTANSAMTLRLYGQRQRPWQYRSRNGRTPGVLYRDNQFHSVVHGIRTYHEIPGDHRSRMITFELANGSTLILLHTDVEMVIDATITPGVDLATELAEPPASR